MLCNANDLINTERLRSNKYIKIFKEVVKFLTAAMTFMEQRFNKSIN